MGHCLAVDTLDDASSVWRVVGSSVPGDAHIHQARPNDDAWGQRALPNQTLVLAVADGAGSASRAHLGSRSAVEESILSASKLLGARDTISYENVRPLGEAIVSQTSAALARLAENLEVPIRELATTLLVCIVQPFGVTIIQIGDGCVVLEHPSGRLTMPVWPHDGEYINETTFITERDSAARATYLYLRYIPKAIALMTDGVEPVALDYAHRCPFRPFFTRLFSYARDRNSSPQALESLLSSARMSEYSSDDKTIVLAVR